MCHSVRNDEIFQIWGRASMRALHAGSLAVQPRREQPPFSGTHAIGSEPLRDQIQRAMRNRLGEPFSLAFTSTRLRQRGHRPTKRSPASLR